MDITITNKKELQKFLNGYKKIQFCFGITLNNPKIIFIDLLSLKSGKVVKNFIIKKDDNYCYLSEFKNNKLLEIYLLQKGV